MGISAADVQKLRQSSGAGMMDCKKALAATDGDFSAALDWLRKKGIDTAAKKSLRSAGEGIIVAAVDGNSGLLLEIRCETDFVTRNDQFRDFANRLAATALANGCQDGDRLKQETMDDGITVSSALTQAIMTIGENITIGRLATLEGDEPLGLYMHGSGLNNMGSIGVLVAVKSGGNHSQLAKHIAMHIAAMDPMAITTKDIDPASLEREKGVLRAQAATSGKPDKIIEKMILGRLDKWYSQVALLEQTFVIDGENPVKKVLKDHQPPASVQSFIRLSKDLDQDD